MLNDDTIDTSSGEAKKPEIITFYNITKGAVDVVDEMSAGYSTARISKRWRMVVFFSLMNIAAINACELLLSTKKPPMVYKNRRIFIKKLALGLTKEQTEIRSNLPCLPRKLKDHSVTMFLKTMNSHHKTKN
ncbi:hypothetical protein JTE90_003353 [Oedothorax gibbosus]|uniref:PiggyBac transposable element-derived protein domain-containing protein n=1 Tax=Oedothorax gibbosus TaxID=931172 RepID=A0AAV6TXH6_9ARAC|nr:hypothetical protein JTE90_003353 [Oedothorax gibbosus]